MDFEVSLITIIIPYNKLIGYLPFVVLDGIYCGFTVKLLMVAKISFFECTYVAAGSNVACMVDLMELVVQLLT
ncbi:hypothetical protein YC2023_088385 [Brassica napus]